MNKEIEILIEMCLKEKAEYDTYELSSFINLKFSEGVYPYLKKLLNNNFLLKSSKGKYSLNKENEKVKDILLLTELFGKDSKILFTNNTKRVLEKFSNNPILTKSKLPKNNLDAIKIIAHKTKLIHFKKEQNSEIFFIASWEETTKKILHFFDIKLNFDEEEYKNKMIKFFSTMPNTNSPLEEKDQQELKRINLEYYLSGQDLIIDKLTEVDFSFLVIAKLLTDKKNKEYANNLFAITNKINHWKMLYIYNTDKIEGNPLTLPEVKKILTFGALKIDQDKKEVLETVNSRTALDNIFDTNNDFNIDFIKKLHLATQNGIGDNVGEFKKKENCITDDEHNLIDRTTPSEFVEVRMKSLVDWYHKNKSKLHPFVLASVVHNQFVYIHPFDDGNGRVARLLLNFILIKNGFFPIIFYNDEKQNYYSYLRQGKAGNIKPFVNYCLTIYRTQIEEF